MQITREDVQECYRRILGREPENDLVVDRQVATGQDRWSLISDFVRSPELSARISRQSVYSLLKSTRDTYLALGLSQQTRTACLIRNFAALAEALGPASLNALLTYRLSVVDGSPLPETSEVVMFLFSDAIDEGEISLMLCLGGKGVAILAFTIAPAEEFSLPGRNIILVSRLQGCIDAKDSSRSISLALGDISPPHVLMAVLEGLAMAMGIEHIVGVSARTHPAFRPEREADLLRSYDRYFEAAGFERRNDDMFVSPVPRLGRPIEEKASRYRARTRRKRRTRGIIAEAARTRWLNYMFQIS